MTDYKRIFIDTAPFIYYLEKSDDNVNRFIKMQCFLKKCNKLEIELFTSAVTVEEYCVYPYREGRQDLVENFERLLGALNIRIINIDETIAKTAAKIRADHKSFKGMDAIQLAVAQEENCDLFLTNDIQLLQYDSVKCITIDELEI